MTTLTPSVLEFLGGRKQVLKGNQAVVLDDPGVVWIVRSGRIAVFATDVADGRADGPRRFLFRVGRHGAAFGCCDATEGKAGLGLLAVALEDTTLQRLPRSALDDSLRRGDVVATTLLENWVVELLSVVAWNRGATTPTVVGAGARGALADGRSVVPAEGRNLWFTAVSGRLALTGESALTFGPDDAPVLVTPGTWLTAVGAAEFATEETWGLADAVRAWSGLANLHRLFLGHCRLVREREEAREVERLRARSKLTARRMESAAYRLAAVLDPAEAFENRDTPLLSAVAQVGAELGMEILPPAASEDMTRVVDPVDAIARASRLQVRRVTLRGDWWKFDSGPLVGTLRNENESRPVALILRGGRYVAVDPAAHTQLVVDAVTADRIAPDAHTLCRPLPDSVRTPLDLVRFATRGRGGDIVFVMAIGLLVTILGWATPYATGLMLDSAIPNADRSQLFMLALALCGAAFGAVLFSVAQALVTARMGIACEAATQAALWDRLLRLRPSFFRKYSTGDLKDRVMAVSQVMHQINGVTLLGFASGVLGALNLLLLWHYSGKLAVVAIVVGLIVIVVTTSFGLAIRRIGERLQETGGSFLGMTIQMIGGVAKVRVAGAEHRAFDRWVSRYTEILGLALRAQMLQDTVSVILSLLAPVSTAVIFWVAVKMMSEQEPGAAPALTIGAFVAFNAAFATFVSAASEVSRSIIGFADSFAKGRRIAPLLAATPEVPPDAADPGRLRGSVALKDVVFRYRADGPAVLDGVSLRAEPGESIAFVGGSGSGKSTILRLLLGFEVPESGSVLFDGKDLSGLDVAAVRRQIGVVLQAGRLNAGSIFDNVALGAAVTYDQVWEAVADAGLADDIERMPMKLHTVVSEGGTNLSGGQRQRILIARALAMRAKIILFDEATSALDNRTQAIVTEALDRRRVTRIVVAHRLSTIQRSDRIYVLDGGRIVQTGTFDQLARQDGLFQRLMSRQTA